MPEAAANKTSLQSPQLQEDQLQSICEAENFFMVLETAAYEECSVEGYLVRGLTITEMNGHNLSFRNMKFVNCRFSACVFERASFQDVVFDNCDLSNCNFSDSYWNRCVLQEIKGPGTVWKDCSLHHLQCIHGQLRYANFTRTMLEQVAFQRCGLQEASFSNCQLKQCQWDQCDMSRADFFRTPLKNQNFSTCQIDGILLSDDYKELQGLTVNGFQAMELAKLLGLRVT